MSSYVNDSLALSRSDRASRIRNDWNGWSGGAALLLFFPLKSGGAEGRFVFRAIWSFFREMPSSSSSLLLPSSGGFHFRRPLYFRNVYPLSPCPHSDQMDLRNPLFHNTSSSVDVIYIEAPSFLLLDLLNVSTLPIFNLVWLFLLGVVFESGAELRQGWILSNLTCHLSSLSFWRYFKQESVSGGREAVDGGAEA